MGQSIPTRGCRIECFQSIFSQLQGMCIANGMSNCFKKCAKHTKRGGTNLEPKIQQIFGTKERSTCLISIIIPLAKKLKDCGVFGVSSDEYYNYAIQNHKE
jgi:hypothetical protein